MMQRAPLILLSNDDGYFSKGIRKLRQALLDVGAQVVLVAPETEQSASSHALSLHRPLRLRESEPGIYAVDGTPADCVYVALYSGTRLLERAPDLVITGLNKGPNLGQDVFYSGTVAAAREGALCGIRALATSAGFRANIDEAARVAARVAMAILAAPMTAPVLFNLNIPDHWNGELRTTRLGSRIYEQEVEFRKDPRGREYLWIGGSEVRHERADGTDTDAHDDGLASLTPLVLELTSPTEVTLAKQVANEAMKQLSAK